MNGLWRFLQKPTTPPNKTCQRHWLKALTSPCTTTAPYVFPPDKLLEYQAEEPKYQKLIITFTLPSRSIQKNTIWYHQFRSSLSESGKDWWNLGGELPHSQTPPRSLPRPSSTVHHRPYLFCSTTLLQVPAHSKKPIGDAPSTTAMPGQSDEQRTIIPFVSRPTFLPWNPIGLVGWFTDSHGKKTTVVQ